MSQQNSQQSPLVGKYMYVADLEYYPRDGSWGCNCFCESFSNGIYTVRTKFGKVYKAQISQIKHLIDITTTQKYQIGDIVYANLEYHQKDGDYSSDYCKVLSVSIFENDVDYTIQALRSQTLYNNMPQNRIVRKAVMCKAKYSIGTYIGVKTMEGCQWDMYTVVKNGKITNVNEWYDRVTYTVRFDNGTTSTFITEQDIVAPAVVKTSQQIGHEEAVFLEDREQQLLRELERVRAMRRTM